MRPAPLVTLSAPSAPLHAPHHPLPRPLAFLSPIGVEINAFRTDRRRDRRRDRRTDRWTDRPSYRDAWTHLKTGIKIFIPACLIKRRFSQQIALATEEKKKTEKMKRSRHQKAATRYCAHPSIRIESAIIECLLTAPIRRIVRPHSG